MAGNRRAEQELLVDNRWLAKKRAMMFEATQGKQPILRRSTDVDDEAMNLKLKDWILKRKQGELMPEDIEEWLRSKHK